MNLKPIWTFCVSYVIPAMILFALLWFAFALLKPQKANGVQQEPGGVAAVVKSENVQAGLPPLPEFVLFNANATQVSNAISALQYNLFEFDKKYSQGGNPGFGACRESFRRVEVLLAGNTSPGLSEEQNGSSADCPQCSLPASAKAAPQSFVRFGTWYVALREMPKTP